jgi:hypothetical protein
MEWMREGINYWHNPDCPKEYLENSLIGLVDFVEGVRLPADHFRAESRESLVEQVAFYEYLSDK